VGAEVSFLWEESISCTLKSDVLCLLQTCFSSLLILYRPVPITFGASDESFSFAERTDQFRCPIAADDRLQVIDRRVIHDNFHHILVPVIEVLRYRYQLRRLKPNNSLYGGLQTKLGIFLCPISL